MSVCLCICVSVCVPKLWGALETSKIIGFGWNLAHLFLGWISGGVFFIFQKFWFLGPGDEFFTIATIGPPNSWKDTEVEPSALRTLDYLDNVESQCWSHLMGVIFRGQFSGGKFPGRNFPRTRMTRERYATFSAQCSLFSIKRRRNRCGNLILWMNKWNLAVRRKN